MGGGGAGGGELTVLSRTIVGSVGVNGQGEAVLRDAERGGETERLGRISSGEITALQEKTRKMLGDPVNP